MKHSRVHRKTTSDLKRTKTTKPLGRSGRKPTHGHHSHGYMSPTYHSWHDMIQRCTNPRRPNYPHYGGAGIRVCQQWLASFVCFLKDMGERPPGTEIDRWRAELGYFPGNCHWATRAEGAETKGSVERQRIFPKAMGKPSMYGRTLTQLAQEFGVSRKRMRTLLQEHGGLCGFLEWFQTAPTEVAE